MQSLKPSKAYIVTARNFGFWHDFGLLNQRDDRRESQNRCRFQQSTWILPLEPVRNLLHGNALISWQPQRSSGPGQQTRHLVKSP
jgi:hypothetical protein